jgi:Uma2 family endonuclease
MVALLNDVREMRKPKVYTFEQYLRREEKATEKHEFYNGKIIKMPGGTDIHSEIAGNVIASLKITVRALPKKFKVYTSDLKIRIESLDAGVYPDALVICEQPEYWQDRRDVITNPLLIVEVLSPSTKAFDRKFDLYKELPSFKEYVLVSTDTPSVETRFREETDLWRMRTETNIAASVALRSLGIAIAMTDIYENIVFNSKK